MSTERKPIKAGSQLIHQTIYNQAGSIQKALLEYIMNSVDAKATEIRIFIDQNGVDYTIQDNGDGFGNTNYTTEEKKKCIDEVFGYLGFDHGSDDENYRVYGKFGIGRAQLWAFSKNTWHTHNMMMDVDIKFKGLEYEIKEVKENFDGCLITGQFYEQIPLNEQVLIKRELSKLSAFAPIEVYFNDVKINRDVSELRSSLDVEHLHIELKPTSSLKVYNQGIFVREYPNYTFGTGGTICSEIGYPFELNAARNDILQSRCKLWRKLKNALDENLGRLSKKKKITDDIRQSLLNRIASGEYEDEEGNSLLTKPLIKMINNRYISIKSLVTDKSFTIEKDKSSSDAEYIHDTGNYVVLMSEFTDCLGINDSDFVSKLKEIKSEKYRFNSGEVRFMEIDVLKARIDSSQIIISKEKLTKRQKLFLEAVNLEGVHSHLVKCSNIKGSKQRTVFIGKSETDDAWTDGCTYIVINEKLVRDLDKGAGNILKIVHLILHEYNHDEDNTDLHSLDFYKNYHDFTIDYASEIFFSFVQLTKGYTNRLIKNDFVVPKKLNRSLKSAELI